jgi:hypothetical protein
MNSKAIIPTPANSGCNQFWNWWDSYTTQSAEKDGSDLSDIFLKSKPNV